jgi:hypothetical protein
MNQADEFRNNARIFRQRASEAKTWLEIAAHWDHLAREADRHPEAFEEDDGESI